MSIFNFDNIELEAGGGVSDAEHIHVISIHDVAGNARRPRVGINGLLSFSQHTTSFVSTVGVMGGADAAVVKWDRVHNSISGRPERYYNYTSGQLDRAASGHSHSTWYLAASSTDAQGQQAIPEECEDVILTVGGANYACTLPANSAPSTKVRITNIDSSNTAKVYPPSGDTINGLTANAATTLTAGQTKVFIGASNGATWHMIAVN